jgi:hypothetical protein
VPSGQTSPEPAAPLADCSWPDHEHPIAIGCLRRTIQGKHPAPTQDGGNRSGNPGADTRHYRTASDEISPVPEQPEWSWTGPVGRFRSDS